MPLRRWIEPQLCKLATKAPSGAQWAHEIKLDGYRMGACIEEGEAPDPIGPTQTSAIHFAFVPLGSAQLPGSRWFVDLQAECRELERLRNERLAGPCGRGSEPPHHTATCSDGSVSYSEHRRGTCSYHLGVANWD
jgi:hypothetical protein